MDLYDFLSLIGGLCLFLFGMNIMSESLAQRSGDRLKDTLMRLTEGRWRGFFTGAGVTALVQSSSATTVLVVGFLTALENLFATEGDEISPLSGIELFRKKVARVVSMGGSAYPESTNNFNYDRDAVGSAAFFDKCPVSVIASSDGDDVVTGYTFTDRLPETHPMRVAYEIYNGGPRKGRSSWDVIATLYALQPNLPFFETHQFGTLRYDEAKELTYWVGNAERQDYQLKYSLSAAEMTEYLENELTDGMMDMLGGFTVLRITGMVGMMGIEFTKEQLLDLNAQLNKIKMP